MSARDELLRSIRGTRHMRALHLEVPAEIVSHVAEGITDALLADGYSMPRMITTAEELDALPSGSVIIDSSGEANVFHDNGWVLPGGPGGYTTWAVAQSLPATVLYEPQP